MDFKVTEPQHQAITGNNGFYQIAPVTRTSMSLKQYCEWSKVGPSETPKHANYDELGRLFWEGIKTTVPLYGAGIESSLFDRNVHEWNTSHLGTILDFVEKDYGMVVSGVTKPSLYFGMWKTSFAWHTEDLDLYSLSYLHFGAPKTWYVVPPKYAHLLERLANDHFKGNHSVCADFLSHKLTLISPEILEQNGIPFNKVQYSLH